MRAGAASLWALRLLVVGAAGCWSRATSVTLPVDPPSDNSCVGVAGFVVTIKPLGRDPVIRSLPNPSPILSKGACRLPQEISMEEIDVDLPIDVTINGYDSLQQLRVTGTLQVPSLDSPGDKHLVLGAAGDTTAGVLVFDRSAALAGRSLADVTDMQVSARSPNCTNPNADIIVKTSVVPAEFFGTNANGAFATPAAAMATLTPGSTFFVCLYFGTPTAQGVTYAVFPSADGYWWRANPL
jgi:hypothetical protein